MLQIMASESEVNLFQRKSVFELLWGYTDPFLKRIVDTSKLFPVCPGPDGGMTDFVQLQVRQLR